MPLHQARDHLSQAVDSVERTHERVTITRHGEPAAVLVSPDDLESLEETLDILSTPGALEEIRAAEAEVARGEYLTAEDITRILAERARRESGAA